MLLLRLQLRLILKPLQHHITSHPIALGLNIQQPQGGIRLPTNRRPLLMPIR